MKKIIFNLLTQIFSGGSLSAQKRENIQTNKIVKLWCMLCSRNNLAGLVWTFPFVAGTGGTLQGLLQTRIRLVSQGPAALNASGVGAGVTEGVRLSTDSPLLAVSSQADGLVPADIGNKAGRCNLPLVQRSPREMETTVHAS